MATTSFAAGAYAATQSLGALGQAKPPLGGASAGGLNFGSLLQGALEGVAQSGRKAETQAIQAATGKTDIVDVVTAVAESEAALETLVAVRDRVIAAYEEIMRMPI
ncbi:MAG: Flagellar hook-basal body complex protein FliE [uncultured Microvirga sp.]|uniref:Flagellar hook-basal body complex protein FliE n=1 Tax=uncultured Microvirga sp. TaxID=412392 RepID=A0A6J4KWW7_9HYPH|nr:MAG: Flagellar hook-basal body complex protein FliE [uncultured Microvirga sp.]